MGFERFEKGFEGFERFDGVRWGSMGFEKFDPQ